MDRIVMHWSAGSHAPSALDLSHYHFMVDGLGKVHPGKFAPEANRAPVKGRYAAHTLNCNTGSIGISLAAMAGAQERPFTAGNHPITERQLAAFVALAASLARQYGIPVTRQTILSHAEVQPTLGIAQRGKWDIAWIPGMAAPGDPVKVGDVLRERITAAMGQPRPRDTPVTAAPARPVLRQGDRGEHVIAMQEAIVATGYRPLLTDGDFGPATSSALRAFQRSAGLFPDAICGPATWAALTKDT